MEQITIQKIYVSDKRKDGTPLLTKDKRPYKKIAILTEEYPNKWMSDFIFREDDPKLKWAVGMRPRLKIWETEEGFTNFKLPTKLDELEERIEALEIEVEGIMGRIDK